MEHPIFQKIEQSKKVDFGDVLSKSYELYKKIWQQGAMHTLIMLIAAIPFVLIVYLPIIYLSASASRYNSLYNYNDYSSDLFSSDASMVLYMIIYLVVVFVMIVLMQFVSMGINAHFFKVCRIVDMGTNEETGDYFSFFKGGNFKKLLLLSLMTFGIVIAAILLCYLPIFYVMVPLQLIIPIFVFNPKLSPKDVIKAAFKLGNKHWLYVFGFVLIASNVAQLGIILCFVGIIFTAIITYLPIYFFYKDSIGFDDDTVADTTLMQQE